MSAREERQAGLDLGGLDVGLKQVGFFLGTVFAVTLAVVIGKQMSAEAMAVVIGVVCGVIAGIPTSLLLFVALTRRERRQEEEGARPGGRMAGAYPPVVVIQGGGPQPQLPAAGAFGGYWPAPAPDPAAARQFNIVGEEEAAWRDPYR